MKNINEYLTSDAELTNMVTEALQDVEEGMTLESFYKSLFINEICESEEEINEFLGLDKVASFFSKASEKGDKAVDNAKQAISQAKDAVTAKFDEWSDAAKSAYGEIKKKAGDAWDGMKKMVNDIIGKIEGALAKVKDALASVCKALGFTLVGIIAVVAELIIALVKKSAELAKKLFDKGVCVVALATLTVGVKASEGAALPTLELVQGMVKA